MIRAILKLAISIGLIWFLVRGMDLRALSHEIVAVNRPALLLGLALAAVTLLFSALRWSAVLAAIGHPIGLRVAFPILLTTQFFSQILPTSIGGDVVRMLLARRIGLSGRASFSSVLIDRAVGLLALCLIITAMLPILASVMPKQVLLGSLALALCLAYGGVGAAMFLDLIPASLHRFRAVAMVADLAGDLRQTLLRPRPALLTLLPNFAGQAAQVAMVAVFARALGLDVSYLSCLAVVPLASLAALAPISIGGWGLRESGFVMGFSLFGIAAPDALAMSVLMGLSNALVSVPGGIIWLALRERRPLPSDEAA